MDVYENMCNRYLDWFEEKLSHETMEEFDVLAWIDSKTDFPIAKREKY